MSKILILEDEHVIRTQLRRLLERHNYEVEEAGTVNEALALEPSSFDLILADLRLPGDEGTAIIPSAEHVPVIIMTSYASVRSAVESMKQGAIDYISKPFDHEEMLLLIERTLRSSNLKRQNRALKKDLARNYPVGGMIGNCEQMKTVFNYIKRVAPTDITVLILGESGTGKELVARALHEESLRNESPLIAVNCAAIPETLLESELFGHEKGAFTGADERRKGLAESANGGTLFLDEIGEMPMSVQARLLRLLQEKEIRPVGSSHSKKVDIRVVAATNRRLIEQVNEGQFREDLYYRLKVMEINLPPLHERGKDIISLGEKFLEKSIQSINCTPITLSTEAKQAMQKYTWPGNVRELQNAVERAVILCDGEQITPTHLGLSLHEQAIEKSENVAATMSLNEYFRYFVETNQVNMSETELAKQLGISRKALWERRQKMGIEKA